MVASTLTWGSWFDNFAHLSVNTPRLPIVDRHLENGSSGDQKVHILLLLLLAPVISAFFIGNVFWWNVFLFKLLLGLFGLWNECWGRGSDSSFFRAGLVEKSIHVCWKNKNMNKASPFQYLKFQVKDPWRLGSFCSNWLHRSIISRYW